MKKAIVSYPHNGAKIEVERELMQTKADIDLYFKRFPKHKMKGVRENFEYELSQGNIPIINPAGGWCVETTTDDSIRIVKYL